MILVDTFANYLVWLIHDRLRRFAGGVTVQM